MEGHNYRLIERAATRLKGAQRRMYLAEVCRDLCGGSPRYTEERFGWGRETIRKGVTPFGILVIGTGLLSLIFGDSETSDFWDDCFYSWWLDVRAKYRNISRLVIYMNNGPNHSSEIARLACSGRAAIRKSIGFVANTRKESLFQRPRCKRLKNVLNVQRRFPSTTSS